MSEDWAAVARAINQRMAELDLSQRELIARSQVSKATVREIQHNTAQRRGGRLFERAAINPRFPVAALERFHARFKDRAGAFLWSLDAKMRRHEASGRKGRTIRLGVGVFAFEEPSDTKSVRKPRSRSSS